MEPGDLIIVNNRRHPLNGCKGKVVGRRGACGKDDTWILVYVPSRMRSYLIPQSLLAPDVAAVSTTWKLQ
jgi:hypothetical protein